MKKIILTLLFSCSILFGQEKYTRDKFGNGWNTFKGCISVREHVLIINTKDIITTDSKNCILLSGEWYSIWENKYFSDPQDMDIDHTVPLKWAYEHGANKWTLKQRNDYANNYVDKYHLVPLSVHNNRSKSDKGPNEWMPPYNRCLYITTFIKIVDKYKLILSNIEKKSFNNILQRECKK